MVITQLVDSGFLPSELGEMMIHSIGSTYTLVHIFADFTMAFLNE